MEYLVGLLCLFWRARKESAENGSGGEEPERAAKVTSRFSVQRVFLGLGLLRNPEGCMLKPQKEEFWLDHNSINTWH